MILEQRGQLEVLEKEYNELNEGLMLNLKLQHLLKRDMWLYENNVKPGTLLQLKDKKIAVVTCTDFGAVTVRYKRTGKISLGPEVSLSLQQCYKAAVINH